MHQYHLALVEYLKTVYLFGQFKEISAEAQYMAGLMHRKTGKKDEARQAFEKVLSDYPGSEWAEKAKKEL
jgi:TolA-binding protein